MAPRNSRPVLRLSVGTWESQRRGALQALISNAKFEVLDLKLIIPVHFSDSHTCHNCGLERRMQDLFIWLFQTWAMDLVFDFLITESVRLTDHVLKINYQFSDYLPELRKSWQSGILPKILVAVASVVMLQMLAAPHLGSNDNCCCRKTGIVGLSFFLMPKWSSLLH